MNTSDIITLASCCAIVMVFIFYMKQIWCINTECVSTLKKALGSTDLLKELENTELASAAKAYAKTIDLNFNGLDKTNVPADEYFSEFSICKSFGVNPKMIEAGAGTLVGLGLLGTFLGLTIGINGFDSSSTDLIRTSIKSLLGGMATAFTTSLVGMFLSLIFTCYEKHICNNLSKIIYDFTQILDKKYYISDNKLAFNNQRKAYDSLSANLVSELHAAVDAVYYKIKSLFEYKNSEGLDVPIANAIREILYNNEEQTHALKAFSTDLAMQLNDGFDEMLSRQMQQRLIPLMESVDATTKTVVEHIDNLIKNVNNPAIELVEKVVSDLKTNVIHVLREFIQTFCENSYDKLENLNISLTAATKIIAEIPNNIESASNILTSSTEEMSKSIIDISKSSAHTNSDIMKQMQEQTVAATASMNKVISDIRFITSDLNQISHRISTDLIEQITKTSEHNVDLITNAMHSFVSKIDEMMIHTTEHIFSKSESLLNLQERSTNSTNLLIDNLNNTVNSITSSNKEVENAINLILQSQANIKEANSTLISVSNDFKETNNTLVRSQQNIVEDISRIHSESGKKFIELINVFESIGATSSTYVNQFGIIKEGINQIFNQIQTGLKEYSDSIASSLHKYLETYSNNLTSTTDALASTINQQNDLVEHLIDTVKNTKESYEKKI